MSPTIKLILLGAFIAIMALKAFSLPGDDRGTFQYDAGYHG